MLYANALITSENKWPK